MRAATAPDVWQHEMAAAGVHPLWDRLRALVPPEPRSRARAAAWSYAAIRPLLLEAAARVPEELAERRVLVLENPGLGGASAVADTLYAGYQIIMPGEIARAHRHAQAALRLVIEGDGAYTAVDGERAWMQPGDLVLTPPGTWHDHGHEGAGPFVWLDVLDIPLVTALGPTFAEAYPGEARQPEARVAGDSLARYGSGLKPVGASASAAGSRAFTYPFARTQAALAALAGAPDPRHGLLMEFADPLSGGAVLPTISAFAQALPPGFAGETAQTTENLVLHVIEGAARLEVEEDGRLAAFDLARFDSAVVPCWRPHRLASATGATLFRASDRVVQQKLALFREAQ